MQKIPTLFQRNPDDMRHLLREVHPDCGWVLAGEGRATRKFDGSCMCLDDAGRWWSRREVKPGKAAPPGWVEVAHDPETGKSVGWEPVEQSTFAAIFQWLVGVPTTPGTYELCGPKVNRNPEHLVEHALIPHGQWVLRDVPLVFDELAAWLNEHEYEGVVWHHADGRMAKIKRRDFPPAGER